MCLRWTAKSVLITHASPYHIVSLWKHSTTQCVFQVSVLSNFGRLLSNLFHHLETNSPGWVNSLLMEMLMDQSSYPFHINAVLPFGERQHPHCQLRISDRVSFFFPHFVCLVWCLFWFSFVGWLVGFHESKGLNCLKLNCLLETEEFVKSFLRTVFPVPK